MAITEEEFEAEQGFDYSYTYSYNYGLISRFLTRTATNHVAAITNSADRVATYHRDATNHVEGVSTFAGARTVFVRTASNHVEAITQSADHDGVTKPRTASNHVAPISTGVDAGTLNWRIGDARLDPETEVEASITISPYTTHIAARVGAAQLDALRAAFDHVADLTVDIGAGGTLDAVAMGSDDAIAIGPPPTMRPPFDAHDAHRHGYDERPATVGWWDVQLELHRSANRDPAFDAISEAGDWTISTTRSTVAVDAASVEPIDADGDMSGRWYTLTLHVSSTQTGALLDDLGYPDAVVTWPVPDGDAVVDAPDGQTVTLDTPADASLSDGDYAVRDWTATQIAAVEVDRPWRVELELHKLAD